MTPDHCTSMMPQMSQYFNQLSESKFDLIYNSFYFLKINGDQENQGTKVR